MSEAAQASLPISGHKNAPSRIASVVGRPALCCPPHSLLSSQSSRSEITSTFCQAIRGNIYSFTRIDRMSEQPTDMKDLCFLCLAYRQLPYMHFCLLATLLSHTTSPPLQEHDDPGRREEPSNRQRRMERVGTGSTE